MVQITSDVAYDYIRKRILSGDFPMGHPLKTEALSAAIGVSRTPVRDALRRLEADGIVEIQSRFGARVKFLDYNEFSELCMMRLALESLLAGVAAEFRTERELSQIEHALSRMRELSEKILALKPDSDPAVFQRLFQEDIREDIRFHIAIMTAAHKERIKKEIMRLHLINRIVAWDPAVEGKKREVVWAIRNEEYRHAMKTHEEIYRGIRERDPTAARDAMAQHIQHIIDSNLKRLSDNEMITNRRPLTEDEEIYTV